MPPEFTILSTLALSSFNMFQYLDDFKMGARSVDILPLFFFHFSTNLL
jgi:hypothetical protein